MAGSGKWRSAVSWTLALLITFVACEVTLRVYQRLARGVPMTTLLPYQRDTLFRLSPFLVFGPRIDWQIPDTRNPELARFNSQGIRIPGEVGPKQPNEFRIFALGGSTTENIWNDLGIHWPLVLECELRAAGHEGVRVYNTAMSAYTTAHSLVRLQFDVMDYEPDMVLIMHNINDVAVSYDAARAGRPVDGHYHVRYAQKSFTGVLDNEDVVLSRLWFSFSSRVRDLLAEPVPRLEEYDLAPGRRIFKRNLTWMTAVAREGGAETVLLTMPFSAGHRSLQTSLPRPGEGQVAMSVDPGGGDERQAADLRSFNTAVLEAAEASGALAVDMAGLFGGEPDYFADIVHYRAEGIERFGEILATQLAPHLPPAGPAVDPEELPEGCRW
jgi:lysophospholipase L1-like esterase